MFKAYDIVLVFTLSFLPLDILIQSSTHDDVSGDVVYLVHTMGNGVDKII